MRHRTPRRVLLAAPLALALLAACGDDKPAPIPVPCGTSADGGPLVVNAVDYTCGTATSQTTNVYTFTAAASAQHTVTLATTRGDADLCVKVLGGGFIDCSINFPPALDVIAFTTSAGTAYQVEVDDAFGTFSTYGVRVTSP